MSFSYFQKIQKEDVLSGGHGSYTVLLWQLKSVRSSLDAWVDIHTQFLLIKVFYEP